MPETVPCESAFVINWMEYRTKKSVPWSKWKGNTLEVRLHPFKYFQFLQEVYNCNYRLEEIYEALHQSYFESLKGIAGFADPNRFQDYIKHVTEYIRLSSWMEGAGSTLEELKESIKNAIKFMRGRYSPDAQLSIIYEFLAIGSAFTLLLDQLSLVLELASSGRFVNAYREMRRAIEDLAWLYINDAAALNTKPDALRRIMSEVLYGPSTALVGGTEQSAQSMMLYPPFAFATFRWFRVSQQCKIHKNEAAQLLGRNIDYLSLLALAFPSSDSKQCALTCELKRPSTVPCVDPDSLERLLKETKNPLLETFRKKKSTFKLGQGKGLVLKFPTQEFMIKLASELLKRHEQLKGEDLTGDLEELYDSYSNFIHAYESTRVPLHGISVAEAVIFSKEVRNFARVTEAILNDYRKMVKVAAKEYS